MLEMEVIQKLNDEHETFDVIHSLLSGATPELLTETIDAEQLTSAGQLRLLEAIHSEATMIPVLCRCAEESGFGMELARAVSNSENSATLESLLTAHGLRKNTSKTERQRNLGRFLTDRRLLMWALGILFSRNTLRALAAQTRDSTKGIRMRAIEYLADHESDAVKEVLFNALDDTNQAIRDRALELLAKKYPKSEIETALAEREREADTLGALVESAKGTMVSVIEKIPGVAATGRALKGIADTSNDAVNYLLTGWNKLINSHKPKDGNAVFAIYTALAWADGALGGNERAVLNEICDRYEIDASLRHWIEERPDLTMLALRLKDIDEPEILIKDAAGALGLNINDSTVPWIEEIETILGVRGCLTGGR